MTIFRDRPWLAFLVVWAVLVVSAVAAVFLYHYELSVGMGMGASAVIVALIGIPAWVVDAAIKARSK